MEKIEKREQSPEDAITGKIKLLQRRYDIAGLMALLGITEDQVFYSAKKLPNSWKRSTVFNNKEFIPSESMVHNVQKMKRGIFRYTAIEIAEIHTSIVAAGGSRSHLECLLIRYARNFFKRSSIR